MAGAVSVSKGVMAPLLDKLATLVGDEYKKLKGVRKQAAFLQRELSAMNAALEKLELMDELEPDRKNWRDHIREMAYDMEDCIDGFTLNLGGADDKEGFIKKTIQRLKTLGSRHRIAGQIEYLKALVIEANERRKRYKIDDCNSSFGFVSVDPRVSVIYKEASGLVGIDGPREELTNWLMDTDKNLKVVSIVGFGGLGKTTLAKQLYDKIGMQFDCKAFVPISQRPNVPCLLKNIQSKFGINEPSQDQDVHGIIDHLRKHLKHKRYFIVADDLWDQQTWDIISCAFPDNKNGSRIIVTTRVEDVASFACCNCQQCIYKMKCLNEEDSKRLFFSRISRSNYQSHFEEVSAGILKKCGGLPLAIITIASLLASRPEMLRKDWETIRNHLDDQCGMNFTMDRMKQILGLSYIHLPVRLRSCLLYLGMYPEDQEIKRGDLVRQWIAEGLVISSRGLCLEDVATSYFNELINVSMILPERIEYGEVLSCRVHDMMLEFIVSKCFEDNFLSVAYNYEDMASLRGCKYKVRRLSLSLRADGRTDGTIPDTITSILSQVRSLAWFEGFYYMTPRLLLLKYLRVLVIETGANVDLTSSQLFHLKYLKVSAHTVRLCEIGGLVHLETLEVYANYLWAMLSDVVQLPRLSCLIVPGERYMLPKGIKNMKSLCTLHGFSLDKSSLEDIIGLGELTNLRDLKFDGGYMETTHVDALVSSIRKLRELRYLTCHNFLFKDKDNRLGLLSNPPLHLKVLDLACWQFPRVPRWIGDLHCLCRLELGVEKISSEEVHVVGALPSLVHLVLRVIDISTSIFGTGSFPVLELFHFRPNGACDISLMAFEAGAMPKLRNFTLSLNERWKYSAPLGMEHLLSLEQIDVHLDCATSESLHDVEAMLRNVAHLLPSPPSVTVTQR